MVAKKPGAKRRAPGNRLLRLAVVAFAVYSAVSILSLQAEVRRSEQELADWERMCRDQGTENKELEMQISEGNDQDYIVRTARERLDYAYPYETVFINASGS